MTAYKGMMAAGVPNFVFALGYTNLSWTLRVDLVCEHFCRLVDYMDEHGHDTVMPVLDDPAMERLPFMDLTAGYVQRGIATFPRVGAREPWAHGHAYERDVDRLRNSPVENDALTFTSLSPARGASLPK